MGATEEKTDLRREVKPGPKLPRGIARHLGRNAPSLRSPASRTRIGHYAENLDDGRRLASEDRRSARPGDGRAARRRAELRVLAGFARRGEHVCADGGAEIILRRAARRRRGRQGAAAGRRRAGPALDESRYDRADTIGQDLPIILATATGYANATAAGQLDPLPAEVRSPRDLEALCTAKESLEAVDGTTAIALPPDDAMLWAVALTGLEECELEALESNLGA